MASTAKLEPVRAGESEISRLLVEVGDPTKLASLPPETVAALRGELARIDSLLLRRLVCDVPAHPEVSRDRLLNAAEASSKLGTTEDWLYRNAAKLSFTVRLGKKQLRFSEVGIERYIRQKSRSL